MCCGVRVVVWVCGVGVCNVCDIDNDSFKCYFDQQSLIILLLCCVSFSPISLVIKSSSVI